MILRYMSEKATDAKNKLITQETQKTGRTKHMKKPINKNPKKKGGLKLYSNFKLT
jgi:hypothetical protein